MAYASSVGNKPDANNGNARVLSGYFLNVRVVFVNVSTYNQVEHGKIDEMSE